MIIQNKYHMTVDQNRRIAKQNLTRLVYTNSRFEGLTTTLPQTQTIIDGLGVDGVSIDDINTIVQLKRGWQYIINDPEPLTFDKMKSINKIVALHDAYEPGAIRTGSSQVVLMSDDTYTPEIPSESKEKEYFEDLMNKDTSATDKAITLMYHNMRNQIFWDGNKRSATLAANKIMIDNGVGLINIPLNKWGKWNELISNYYRTNEIEKIKEWTYENGIQGIDLNKKREKNYQSEAKEIYENTISTKEEIRSTKNTSTLDKADMQLNRVYARKFLKENHFALNKENIQQVSQNIAQNRANNKKQNRDSSVEAAYRIEKEKLSDPATRSNYQKKYKKSSKTNETRKIDSPLIQNNDLSR